MAIKFAAWNVEGRLSGYKTNGRGSVEHILRGLEKLDADVLVLPEAFLEQTARGVNQRLKQLGYEWYDVSYGEAERDWSKEFMGKMASMRVLSRIGMTDVRVVRWGDMRNMINFVVLDPETHKKIQVIATHLDDRSEANRVKQVEDLVKFIHATDLPVVMLGDFNAMWRTGRARLLRSSVARMLARSVPQKNLRFAATRVNEMAMGNALNTLMKQAHLRDVDPRRRPTATPKQREMPYMPSIRLVQIDHILVSLELEAANFRIGKDSGSDHRSITAEVSLKEVN